MTEKSYFWYGSSVGDAVDAPYTIDHIHAIFRKIFCSLPETDGVIKGYGNELAVTNPGTNQIEIATGAALVYGRFYENDAVITNLDVTAPGAGSNYYTYVLSLDDSAQTIRVVRLGPNASAYPDPTQDAIPGTWEILLAQVRITSGGVVTLTDGRSFWRMNGQQLPIHLAHQAQSESNRYLGGSEILQFEGLHMNNGTIVVPTDGGADDVGACKYIPYDDPFFADHDTLYSPMCHFVTPITNDPNIMPTIGQQTWPPKLGYASWADFTGATHTTVTLGYLFMNSLSV